MENFIVSARKYRPTTFDSVVGQLSITSTLKNAIKSNHLAQAFLFCGPRGVGKTTCARILAKTINCFNVTENIEACNECESCKAFDEGHSLNIHELDGASNNSVDDIRSLIDQVRFAPQIGTHKVYIIDEVHMLSQAAFNAFLKTLEEPPKHAIFILATTEKHKIIPTILSRCQIFDFNRIQIEDIATHLQHIATNENVDTEEDGLHIIAQKADGALRDALSMFDQIVSFSGGSITYKDVIDNLNILDYDYYFRVTDAIINKKVPESLLIFNEILNNGFDGHNFINGLAEHFRNLLVCLDEQTVSLLEVGANIKEKYAAQAKATKLADLIKSLAITNEADTKYKGSKNQRLLVEVMLMQLCALGNELTEKKNSIINLVIGNKPPQKVTPKPNYPTPERVQQTVEEPKNQPQATQQTPVVKKAVSLKPKVGLNFTDNISINAAPKEEKKNVTASGIEVTPENRPTENFTPEQFAERWKAFKGILEDKGKSNLASIFEVIPEIENDTIKILVENRALEDEFKAQQSDFIDFIRLELSNFNIQVTTEINKEVTNKKAYTPQEKFTKMSEKNPTLKELVKKLDMDVGYA
ncbi:MAG: DNA polymerase III subunit gamma/tau [Vicingaceae bacterium]|nr:DNA polymerase III subunit gamma/tau [Vicingaceae bacterium]